MKKSQFSYNLPKELIAQYPLGKRSDSKLLVYNRKTKGINHDVISNITTWLNPGDLLVFNDSRVIPARFYGAKTTGGKVEFLIERLEDDYHFIAHIKSSKAPRDGSEIILENDWRVKVIAKNGSLYKCVASDKILDVIADIGHIPLPMYFNRDDEELDVDRYQTIYAKNKGSVAAPTAGLHFDDDIFNSLEDKGVNVAYATLHVGAGTFQPVRVEDIKQHTMHSESYTVSQELCDKVVATKVAGGRVIAVGTTAMRSLESAALDGKLQVGTRDTDIFITPGYEFKVCDGLITNFHLPESTLLMLVAALIGHQEVMQLYSEAIANKYRFYSYGDASLLL